MNSRTMNWTDGLSIGNDKIDNDHKKLIEVYNQLIELIESGGNRNEFAQILSNMTDYALKHIRNEENYMKEFAYPNLIEHKKLHRDYILKVAMYNTDLLGTNPPDPNEITNFLEKWWTNHILKNDIVYENYKKTIDSEAIYRKF